MSLKQKTTLSTLIMIAGMLTAAVGAYTHVAMALIGAAVLFAGLLLHLRWYRCPHCGAFLGRDSIPNFCPSCGVAIDPDRKTP